MTSLHHPPVVLVVDPTVIPAMRVEVETALHELSSQLMRLGYVGHIPEAWLGDSVSQFVQNHYQKTVMDSSTGPYAALLAYEAELVSVYKTLKRMEDEYRRTEGDNAALWDGRT